VSLERAYREARRTGCVYGSRREVLDQLAYISIYLGTCDPADLVAALLLEQAGYERSDALAPGEQLALEMAL